MRRMVRRAFWSYAVTALLAAILWAISGTCAPALAASSQQQSSPVAAVPAASRNDATMASRFIQAGAYTLALRLADTQQPPYAKDPAGWVRWERVRLQALQRRHAWKAIAKRIAALPKALKPARRAEFTTLGVRAELAQSHGVRARRLLRSLLWRGNTIPDAGQLRLWRRMLIESYLDAGQLEDARLALLNYQLDYTPRSGKERAVLARVWLRVNEPKRALELLSAKLQPDTHWLYWLASLRAGTMTARTVIKQAVRAAVGKGLSQERAALLWGVVASAALKQHDWTTAIDALEHYLALAPQLPLTPLLPFDGDTLWHAYHAYGMQAGNRAKLLVGDDMAWEDAAKQARKNGHEVLSRAYNATLAQIGQSPKSRSIGYRWLGASALGLPHGKRLLDRLFLSAPKQFATSADIPVVIRLVLANDAVDRGDLSLAARLMEGLNKVPSGEDPYLWSLRLARVLVLGGRAEAGVKRLHKLIGQQKSFDRKQADQLMQVLFDLQSTKQNAAALGLFEELYPKLAQAQLQREVLFWEAQSCEALGQEARAAGLYMQSALLLDGKAYGPWGMTARYNAALAMNKAGMTAGAMRVLQDLLAHTKDAARASVLKRTLAELRRLPVQAPQAN
jgi:hypothetical protein